MSIVDRFPYTLKRDYKKGHSLVALHDNWQRESQMQPLLITAELATPYIPAKIDEPVHLDGLLGAAVLTSLPVPSFFPPRSAAVVPIPLKILWTSGDDLPLWAATTLYPVGDMKIGKEYWHKRYPSDRADLSVKRAALTSAGRWKEFRTPVPVVTTNSLMGICIGVHHEVERLLKYVTHVGKKSNSGYGRVGKWSVIELPHNTNEVTDIIIQNRPVPVNCPLIKDIAGCYNHSTGWTPPYWYAPWHRACITPKRGDNERINIDWF